MKRRNFLKGLVTVPALVAVPAIAQSEPTRYVGKRRVIRPRRCERYGFGWCDPENNYAKAIAEAMRKTKEEVAIDVYTRAFKGHG
jgi:hypothetical protein